MDIRVAIFEDNKMFRGAIEAILNGSNGYKCVGSFESGANWEINIQRTEPQVILMDIELPEIDGIELTKRISERFPEIKLLIQTVFDDGDKIFRALCSGASGYILKGDPPIKYLDGIAEVYNGGAPMSSTVAKKILGFFANKNVILVTPDKNDFKLTERETELLRMMVAGNDFKFIALKTFISYETVRTHAKNIYKKLHVVSRSEAVMKAIQQGLV